MKNCDEYWDIETAFLRGRDVLVVIKTGAGGTVNGYQDKYKKLAEYIHHRTGYAVLTVPERQIEFLSQVGGLNTLRSPKGCTFNCRKERRRPVSYRWGGRPISLGRVSSWESRIPELT